MCKRKFKNNLASKRSKKPAAAQLESTPVTTAPPTPLAATAAAADDGKYPDFNGQWRRATSVRSERIGAAFDPSKPFGRGEEAPLTPEYQAIYEANLADMERKRERGPGHRPDV